jgi:hypothetical protein
MRKSGGNVLTGLFMILRNGMKERNTRKPKSDAISTGIKEADNFNT